MVCHACKHPMRPIGDKGYVGCPGCDTAAHSGSRRVGPPNLDGTDSNGWLLKPLANPGAPA